MGDNERKNKKEIGELLFKRDAGKDQRSYEVCRTENVVLSSISGAGPYVGDNERKNKKEIGEK